MSLPQQMGAFVAAGSAPGSREASCFFDRYPRFHRTVLGEPCERFVPSATGAPDGRLTTARLNLRYEAIFGENRDIFQGASVLDLASNDGRWLLAALATGARSGIGIEAGPVLVLSATENLAEYGYGADRARFITGDVHQVLGTQDFEVDVVLCLGFLYHTLRYNELLHGIRRTKARYLVIDTFSPHMMEPVANVTVMTEDADGDGKAATDNYTNGATALVGCPNLAAIQTMLGAYGYRAERLSDWAGLLRDNSGADHCDDYALQNRVTLRCGDTTAGRRHR